MAATPTKPRRAAEAGDSKDQHALIFAFCSPIMGIMRLTRTDGALNSRLGGRTGLNDGIINDSLTGGVLNGDVWVRDAPLVAKAALPVDHEGYKSVRNFGDIAMNRERFADKLVISGGQYRSGSTLIFNALIEMAKHQNINNFNKSGIISFYSDDVGSVSEFLSNIDLFKKKHEFNSVSILIKTHKPNENMVKLINHYGGKVVWTHRDPRDCVASFITQFYRDFAGSLRSVSNSCNAYFDFSEFAQIYDIVYERDLIGDNLYNTFEKMAEYLGINLNSNKISNIANTLQAQNVKKWVSRQEISGKLNPNDPVRSYDPQRQWHANHVGDGRIGKYTTILEENQTREVESKTIKYMRKFNYRVSVW